MLPLHLLRCLYFTAITAETAADAQPGHTSDTQLRDQGLRDHLASRGKAASMFEPTVKRLRTYFLCDHSLTQRPFTEAGSHILNTFSTAS